MSSTHSVRTKGRGQPVPETGTLLSLVSHQVWPQILAALHLRPKQLVLLHSADEQESGLPAKHLRRFFERAGVLDRKSIQLRQIPHDDFAAVGPKLDHILAQLEASAERCVLNFTGGNKLMANAAFHWATAHGMRSFYLERARELTWFLPGDTELATTCEEMDGHMTDAFDPAHLLSCQIDASELERKGELLRLSLPGRELPADVFQARVEHGWDPSVVLQVEGEADRDDKEGDRLERAAAAVVLKLGVVQVRRSLRLKVRSAPGTGTRLPHAEIDLLFSWDGRLWLVDCKDRRPAEDLVQGVRRELRQAGTQFVAPAEELMRRIESELTIGRTKVLKEDLVAIRETGGLLGQVVCVRKEKMPPEAVQYADKNGIALIRKTELWNGFRNLLFPGRAPDAGELASLASSLGSQS